MLSPQLEKLCDMATEAHTAIQRDFANIDPLVGVSQQMRGQGIPADTMTIDCLRTRRRIIIILHDQEPEVLRYQFAQMDADPEGTFEVLPLTELSAGQIYNWIAYYFSE